MKHFAYLKTPFIAGAFITLGACASPQIESAQRLDIQGSDAASEAAREYKRLAFFEHKVMWDKASAVAFSEKALAAASGEIQLQRSPETSLEIEDAYNNLAVLRAAGSDAIAPKFTGQAIAKLHCWQEQAREGDQPLHIGFCKNGFSEHLASTARVIEAAGLKAPKSIAKTNSYSVSFALGSAVPNAEAYKVLERAAAYALSHKDMRIVLGGHADRTGSPAFNQRLSENRAAAIERGLAARGVNPEKISTIGFGETYPRVRTPDGMRSQDNRRVEIVIGPARGS